MTIEYESPFEICPELKEPHLEELAKEMLAVVELTLDTNSHDFDDNYTFETSLFGRIRQLFISLHHDKSKPWVKLQSQSMDYVARICNIPVRVFKDDPEYPKKTKIFFQNSCEKPQLPLLFEENEFDLASTLTWRLLIQAPATFVVKGDELESLGDDFHVVLVGYHPITKSIVSMWRSTAVANTPIRHTVEELPVEKPVERKPVTLKSVDTQKSSVEKNE